MCLIVSRPCTLCIFCSFSVILPEESEAINFEISFEKDPQQEEFLQGRMQNNPYNSSDPTIGPLMRDIKNKICRDTELLALLEEDTGNYVCASVIILFFMYFSLF